MKYVIAASFHVSPDIYIENSSAEMVIKIGNNFAPLVKELESGMPGDYIYNCEIKIFVDGVPHDRLTQILRTRIEKIKEIRNTAIEIEINKEYEQSRRNYRNGDW